MMDSPFEDVLVELNDIASKVDDMAKPVQSLDTVVTSVTTVITDIDNLFVDYNEVCEIVEVVQAVALSLNVIPVVGEIADILSSVTTVLDEVNEAIQPVKVIVDNVDKVFIDVEKGLNTLEKVMKEVVTIIPDTTNTVAILNALIMIAKPLVEILEGTDASTRLAKVVDEYDTIKQNISKDVKPVVDGLDYVVTIVDNFVQEINDFITHIKSTVSGAIDSVSSGKGKMTPVKVAVNIVKDIMKPVMWLIHAIEWVYDHTVKPIINEALKVTHISDLVDGLEKDLMDHLGINKIVVDIEKALHLEGLEKYNAAFGITPSTTVGTIYSGFEDLKGDIQNYKQGDTTQKAKMITELVEKLVDAIINTAVDSSKSMSHLAPPSKPSTINYKHQTLDIQYDSKSAKIKNAANSLKQITASKEAS